MTACMTDPASAVVTRLYGQTDALRQDLRSQSEAFWGFQDRLLSHMEQMSRAWFQRRHEGTEAALRAAGNMCRSATATEALQEYAGWASGSLERLTRDALDVQSHLAAMSDLLLEATHKVMRGPSEAGQADIMTPTEADQPAPIKSAA